MSLIASSPFVPAASVQPPRRRLRRSFAVAVCAASAVWGHLPAQAAVADAPVAATAPQAATPSRLAARSLMLDVARCGQRLLMVGERGRILLSDDAGQGWRQARAVPVSVTLTAVQCVDATRGWAVGHAGTVLRTDDAGETWTAQLDGEAAARLAVKAAQSEPAGSPARRNADQLVADGPDKPFLGLEFTSRTEGLVVGAYGLIFSTDDAGKSWHSRIADTDNPKGYHLNAVRTVAGRTWIAGEKGLLLRAERGSAPNPRFAAVKSPYDGSWFALAAAPGGGVLLAGLRGNVFITDESGAGTAEPAWRKVDLPTGATFLSCGVIDGDRLALVAQDGAVHVLGADGRATRLTLPPGAPLTALVQATDGALVAATFRGAIRLPTAALAVASAAR